MPREQLFSTQENTANVAPAVANDEPPPTQIQLTDDGPLQRTGGGDQDLSQQTGNQTNIQITNLYTNTRRNRQVGATRQDEENGGNVVPPTNNDTEIADPNVVFDDVDPDAVAAEKKSEEWRMENNWESKKGTERRAVRNTC